MTQLFLSHNDWLMSCHNNVDENVSCPLLGVVTLTVGERERGGGSKGREGGRGE